MNSAINKETAARPGTMDGGEARSVAVIGARGFIGGHVVRALLKKGYRVSAFSRSDAPFENLEDLQPSDRRSLSLVQCDWTDSGDIAMKLQGHQAAIHCDMPIPLFAFGWRSRWLRQRAALRDFLAACRFNTLKKIVFLSASGTIGGNGTNFVDESSPSRLLKLGTPLAIKELLEYEITQTGHALGIPFVIVNPPLCFGPYDTKPSSGEFLLHLIKGGVLPPLETPVSLADVRNVADGIAAAMANGQTGQRYLLGGGWTTLKTVQAWALAAAGIKKPIAIEFPYPIAAAACIASEIAARALRQKTPSLPLVGIDILRYGQGRYSYEKAQRDFNFQPTDPSLGVRAAVHWLIENGRVPGRSRPRSYRFIGVGK